MADGVRKLDSEDIVHFREICVQAEYIHELQDKINHVKQGEPSQDQIIDWARQLADTKIGLDEFNKLSSRKDDVSVDLFLYNPEANPLNS